jgi:hypothetical protein
MAPPFKFHWQCTAILSERHNTCAKHKIKLFFLGASSFVENGGEEDCTASDLVKTLTAAVPTWQPQGRTPAKSSQPSEADRCLQFFA